MEREHRAKNPDHYRAKEARRDRDWIADTQRRRAAKGKGYFRERNVRAKFGISLQEYELRFHVNGGICPICSCDIALDGSGNQKAALDHDHKTGAIRDFLCNRCNVMLGMAQDDPSRLFEAIKYLEVHSSG